MVLLELQAGLQAMKEGTPQMVPFVPQKSGQDVTLLVFHTVRLPLKAEASANMDFMFVTLVTAQDERPPLKAEALANMACISVTLVTAQGERSPLKAEAK
jgi:hypothetical protein